MFHACRRALPELSASRFANIPPSSGKCIVLVYNCRAFSIILQVTNRAFLLLAAPHFTSLCSEALVLSQTTRHPTCWAVVQKPQSVPERQSSSEETLDRGEFASHRRTARTQVPDVSSLIQPEASGTTLPMANVVRPLGPVAIAGIESLQTPVPQWIPNLPIHPVPADLLEESSFAPH